MTFDEAIDQLEPRTIWSPEMKDLLEQLRKSYAPTIEMTQKQYEQFKTAKGLVTLNELGYVLNKKAAYSSLRALSGNDLANVWLHPECIKVVEK